MVSEKEVDKFIVSQRTFTAQGPEYIKTKKALKEVLLALPDKDYKKVTKNMIIIDEGVKYPLVIRSCYYFGKKHILARTH